MNAIFEPKKPLRLVLITPDGVAVYEGRKAVAAAPGNFDWTAEEIEEIRTQPLPVETDHP